jgi:hypothetical protein
MATTEPSSLPAAAEAANANTLATALEQTHISESGKDKETKSESKGEGEDELEEGEIKDEEEVDDGKPKTVFDSKKNYNLKVFPSTARECVGADKGSTHCLRDGHYISILHNLKCCPRHLDLHLLPHRSLTVRPPATWVAV